MLSQQQMSSQQMLSQVNDQMKNTKIQHIWIRKFGKIGAI